MADISSLSDEELMKMAGVDTQAPPQTVSSSIQDVSDDELMAVAGIQKQNISDAIGTDTRKLSGQIVEGFVSPLVELARGYDKMAAEMYSMTNGVAKLVQHASGQMINTEGLQKFLASAEDTLNEEANKLPETNLSPVVKGAYQMAAQAPGIVAQFEALPFTGPMSFVAKNAILESVKSFDKDEDFQALARGALRGAEEGAAGELGVRAGLKILTRGVDILNRFGNKAFKAWIQTTTGDEQLAVDFLKNPDKFNLRDGRTEKKIIDDYNDKKFELAQANDSALKRVRDKVQTRLLDLKEKNAVARTDLQRLNDSEKNLATQKTPEAINALKEDAQKAIDSHKVVVDSRMNDLYTGTIEKISSVEETVGKEVGMLKDRLRAVSPGVSVSYDDFGKPIRKAIENLPGTKMVSGKVVPIAKTPAKQALCDRANTVLDELTQFRSTGEVPLDFAFEMTQKTGPIQEMISFASKNELFPTYGDALSKIADVATLKNLKIDGVNLLVKSGEARGVLKELVEKNKQYYDLRTKYDNAMKHYAQKDVNGAWKPDPQKAIRAIEQNNVQKIKEMQLADEALPKEDRLLPRVKSLMEDINTFEQVQKKALDVNINAVKKEQASFFAKLDAAEKELSSMHQKLTAEERKKSADMLWEIRRAHRTAFRQQNAQLMGERDRIIGSKTLESWGAKQFGGVQAGLALSSMYTQNAAPLALSALLAPKVASKATRVAKGVSKSLEGVSLKEENAKAIRQLLGLEPRR